MKTIVPWFKMMTYALTDDASAHDYFLYKYNIKYVIHFMLCLTYLCVIFHILSENSHIERDNQAPITQKQEIQLSCSGRFPDWIDTLSDSYQGERFVLSQDYPDSLPSAQEQPWVDTHPLHDPEAYLDALRSYAFAGMREADWRAHANPVRRWYHVPWLHGGDSPREAIRGLTRERPLLPHALGPNRPVAPAQSWAVGMYNDRGALTLGRIWREPHAPDVSSVRFEEGTVIIKLLLTAAPIDDIPELIHSPQWIANIDHPTRPELPKQITTLRVLQIDMAVRDSRAGTSGWIFAAFAYHPHHLATDPWDRFTPIGLTWGNDPNTAITPGDNPNRHQLPPVNPNLTETYISPRSSPLVSRALGWNGRLNGPVDHPQSSCISCHSTAQIGAAANMTPPHNAPDPIRALWFRNLAPHEPFSSDAVSLDYSLQLKIALTLSRFGAAPNPCLSPARH